jgi:hypothetical protein
MAVHGHPSALPGSTQLPPLHQLNISSQPPSSQPPQPSQQYSEPAQSTAASDDMDSDVDRTKHPSGIVPTLQYVVIDGSIEFLGGGFKFKLLSSFFESILVSILMNVDDYATETSSPR